MNGQPYSKEVMDHFLNPRNVGEIPDASGIGSVGNPICGDVMRMYIKVENGIIVDAKFKTFGCLPKGEEVVLSQGGWGEIAGLAVNTQVINSEGKETQVAETYKRNYSGKVLRIIPFLSPFNSFRVTGDHPILCIKREWIKGARRSGLRCNRSRVNEENLFLTEPDFRKASELIEGDYLIFNVNQRVLDNDLFTKEVMRLIGYYLSEGYIAAQGSTVAFAFNKREEELIKEVTELLEKITGKKPKSRVRRNVIEIYVCSRELARFLLFHCKKIARHKALSEDVLLLPFSKQWEMVEACLEGDGGIYKRRPKNSKAYRIVTASKSLAIQIQEILARGGIFGSLRQVLKTGCHVGQRKLKDSLQYLISFKRARDHKFAHYNNKYFLIPIKKIEKEHFRGAVYNFRVCNEPNSYLVKGFAVHNCGAAIATSSMATELIKGKSIEEAVKISNKAVAEALGGLPAVKMHCSVLAEEALKAAIKDYCQRRGKGNLSSDVDKKTDP